MDGDDLVLEVRNVSKIFGRGRDAVLRLLQSGASKAEILERTGAVVAVQDASFSVRRGEFFVIMGLSGSGKSTLIRCLIRLIEPSSGQVIINGQELVGLSDSGLREVRRHQTAMVFQHYGLLPHKTVLENVEYGLKTRGVDKEERRRKALAAIERVGLAGWEDRRPKALSGGMQQRVGLARALAHDPQLLLMDEPFSGLDPLIRKQLRQEFATLQAEVGITTILVTHDVEEAMTLGDRIAIMRDGAIIQIGTPEELVTNPADDYVASFVQDASASRFLTAEQIMDTEPATVADTSTVQGALQSLGERRARAAFVLDKQGTLRGVVAVDALRREASNNGTGPGWTTAIRKAETAPLAAGVTDLLPLVIKSRYPVAIVDSAGRIVGQVTKNSLLEALAEDINGDVDTDDVGPPTTDDAATGVKHVENVSK